MIEWGVIGAGGVAQRRTIPAMVKAEGMRVVALMVRSPDRARKLAAQFGAPHPYHTVQDLLRDKDVNAVYVATPVYLHCGQVIEAAEHGKHVLCEKPMAMNVQECQRMIAACQANHVHLEICFVLRHWPIYKRIKQTIESGGLGKIVEIRGHVVKWKPRQEAEWRAKRNQSGGGCLADVGSHYLDLFRYLIGEYDAISYMGGSPLFHWDVEESAFVTVRFRSGAYGVLTISVAVPYPGHTIEVYGSKGTLLLGNVLSVTTEAGTTEEPSVYPGYYSGLLKHFRQRVEENIRPVCQAEDGLRNIETIMAAYRSQEEARIVSL